jgi:RNA polymerase sigma-70 factor (ECF subfamily)
MQVEAAFRNYGKAMLGAMIRFCRDEQAAQDGVSQAFAQALARKGMLEALPEPAMRAWLYAAARNAIVDAKRREARLSCLADEEALSPISPLSGPADGALVEILLRKLPPKLGIIVRMKYFGRMSASQIGLALAVPAATVRTRLRRALRIMRQGGD